MADVRYHWKMMNDHRRNFAYLGAIQSTVKDKIVLDLGCGAGLLSVMAVQAGARHVYAVEQQDILVPVVDEIFRVNNVREKITFFNCHSSELVRRNLIKEPVDVVVTETIGDQILNEDIIPSLEGIRPLLSAQAICIPEALNFNFCFIDASGLIHDYLVTQFRNIDLTPFNQLMEIIAPVHSLGPPIESWREITDTFRTENFQTLGFPAQFSRHFDLVSHRDSLLHGMIVWSDLILTDKITLSTRRTSFVDSWNTHFIKPRHGQLIRANTPINCQLSINPTGFEVQW